MTDTCCCVDTEKSYLTEGVVTLLLIEGGDHVLERVEGDEHNHKGGAEDGDGDIAVGFGERGKGRGFDQVGFHGGVVVDMNGLIIG